MTKRDVKADSKVREAINEEIAETEFVGSTFLGRTTEGNFFKTADGIIFVVKVTLKKEGFDAFEVIEEFTAEQELKVRQAKEKEARKNGAARIVKEAI